MCVFRYVFARDTLASQIKTSILFYLILPDVPKPTGRNIPLTLKHLKYFAERLSGCISVFDLCIFPPLQPCMSFFTLQSGSTIMRHILDTFPFRLQPTQQVLSSPAPRCQQLRLHMFLSDSHQCCAAVLQLRFMISHFVPLCQLLDPAYVCVCVCGYIYVLSAPWVCSCCHTCSD